MLSRSCVLLTVAVLVVCSLICVDSAVVTLYSSSGNGCTGNTASYVLNGMNQTCTSLTGTGMYGTVVCNNGIATFTAYIRDSGTCTSTFYGTATGGADGATCMTTGPNLRTSFVADCSNPTGLVHAVGNPGAVPIDDISTVPSNTTTTDSPYFIYTEGNPNSSSLSATISILALLLSILISILVQ